MDLHSEAGDQIGAGQRWRFDPQNADFSVTDETSHRIALQLATNQFGFWSFAFEAPTRSSGLEVGLYEPVRASPSATIGGIRVSGDGRGCTAFGNWFEVLELVRNGEGALESLAIDFEHFCSGGSLFGQVRYNSSTPKPTPRPTVTIRVPQELATIQEALDAAEDGDTVLVAPGVYQGPIDTMGTSVRLVSEAGPDQTTIVGTGAEFAVSMFRGADAATSIEGFTVQGGENGIGAGGGVGGPFVIGNVIVGSRTGIQSGGTAVVRNNTIRATNVGIFVVTGGGEIIDNLFEGQGVAIDFNASGDVTVSGNRIFTEAGIRSLNASRPTVVNNLIVTRQWAIDATVPTSGRLVLLHNTIMSERGSAVEVTGFNEDSLIANNILWSAGHEPTIRCGRPEAAAIVANNIVAGTGAISVGCDEASFAADNFFDEPGLVDVAGGDYRLAPGSPNIDRAIDMDVAVDFDGDPRPIDGNGDGTAEPDIGFDELSPILGPCVADCDADGHITVAELVTAVRIALGVAAVSRCEEADQNGDGIVAVSELITAVRAALFGCTSEAEQL